MWSLARFRQVPPTRIEDTALALFQPRGSLKFTGCNLTHLGEIIACHVLQAQAAERQCDAVADLAAVDIEQFKAATTKVAA